MNKESWPPALGDGEVILVHCSLDARRRVPFHLMVTDRRFFYGRQGFIGLVVEEMPVGEVQLATARKLWPIAYWSAGALLVAGFLLYAATIWADPAQGFNWKALGLLAFGVLAFSAGSDRWALTVEGRGRRLKIVQPGSSNSYLRKEMGDAIQQAARLVSDEKARSQRAEEVRRLADPDAD